MNSSVSLRERPCKNLCGILWVRCEEGGHGSSDITMRNCIELLPLLLVIKLVRFD